MLILDNSSYRIGLLIVGLSCITVFCHWSCLTHLIYKLILSTGLMSKLACLAGFVS